MSVLSVLELGVEERLDCRAGELEHQLDEDDEQQQFHYPWGSDEAVTDFVPNATGHEVQAEDDGKHDTPCAATLQEHRKISPLKVGQNAPNDLIGRMERVGTEENPQEGDQTEGQQP